MWLHLKCLEGTVAFEATTIKHAQQINLYNYYDTGKQEQVLRGPEEMKGISETCFYSHLNTIIQHLWRNFEVH